jgi:hypothetical protein
LRMSPIERGGNFGPKGLRKGKNILAGPANTWQIS